MTKRRYAFATPFVLIAGCKAPAPASPQEDERTRAEEAPVVVVVGEPVDAAVDMHLERAAGIRDEVPPDAAGSRVDRCCMNPPLPRKPPPPEPRPVCCVNPPSPQTARILGIEAQGRQVVLRIGLGSNNGVTRDRTLACLPLLGNDETCDPDGTVTLLRVDKTMSVGRVDLSPDRVKQSPHVIVRWR